MYYQAWWCWKKILHFIFQFANIVLKEFLYTWYRYVVILWLICKSKYHSYFLLSFFDQIKVFISWSLGLSKLWDVGVSFIIYSFLNAPFHKFCLIFDRDLSTDEGFPDELKTSIRFLASVLLRRLKKVGTMILCLYILLTVYIIQSYTCASVCTRVLINRCFTCTCSTVLNSGVNFSMMGVKCLLVVFLLTASVL